MKQFFPAALILIVVFAGILSPTVLADAPAGAGPNAPLSASGTWQMLAPNAALWYYFDYPGDKSTVEVDVDANGTTNVQLLIFTPDQAPAAVQDPTTRPVGVGTPPGANSQAAIHDLVWLGGFKVPGRYFAVVQNGNATPISFRIFISGLNVVTAPPPPPTPTPYLPNPFATVVPSGSIQGKLVFQDGSGGNIYTVDGDGTNLTRITSGLDPNWSPDGKQVTFSRWNPTPGLFVINADGTNEQALFSANQLLSPQWSPDGNRIAFTFQSGGSEDMQQCSARGCRTIQGNLHWKIGVVDLTTEAFTQPPCSTHCMSPSWSNDGHTLVYADAQIGLLETDTTANGIPAADIFTSNPEVQSPSYSPDGSKIAFMARQHDHFEINAVSADGSNAYAVISVAPLSFNVVNNVAPTWSPDGAQLLFLSDRNGTWEFFAVNADGTALKQVLKNITDSIAVRYNFSNERVIDWTQ